MRHRLRAAVRGSAAIATAASVLAAAALQLVSPAHVAAAAISFNTTNTSIPLLLVHGFNDDCGTAWNTPGTNQNGATESGTSTAQGYLSAQFSNIIRVGYYTNSNNNTNTDTADTYTCNENLNNDSDPNLTKCNALATSSIDYGNKNDHLDRLSCLLAWYVYDNFTQYGEPLNILAHSMGGLLTRYALGATNAHSAYFPPVLWVNNVVTVATPHGGVWGAYHNFAALSSSTNGVELDMMDPGNSSYTFMSTIAGYQRPHGFDGTRWALIGASDAAGGGDGGNAVSSWTGLDGDGVVATQSQLSMTADYIVEYGVRGAQPYYTVADWNTQYEHETLLKCYAWILACFNGPYYLNDSSTAGTMAWTCSMCSGEPGGNPVAVSRSLAMIAAQLQQKPVPNLPSYNLVWRSDANGNYVSAELGYTGASYAMLRARASALGAWESWTRIQLPTGHWVIRNNGNGLYVSAELAYIGSNYGELRARTAGSAIGPWEIFDFVNNSNGTFSLRSLANGLYVSAELGYTGGSYAELRARASAIGAWEQFDSSTATSPSCVNYGNNTITGPDSCAGTFSDHSIWFSGGGLGLQGQEIWTYANGAVQDSTATWQLSGLSTLYVVEIDAYVPRYHSNAQHVHYHLCAPGNGCTDDYLNQSPLYDQWGVVGYVCTTDGTATITVADDGGDVYPAQIAADALRGVSTHLVC
jgi:triacylglycerol esterase/lipase EstA (alpha/beta hydrolase family)